LREHKICAVDKCETLAASGQIRVFRAEGRRRAYENTFAEWLPTGRLTALANENTFEGSEVEGRPVISGRFVAYAAIVENERDEPGIEEDVARLNAQTGQFDSAPANGKQDGFASGSPRGLPTWSSRPPGASRG
jgi:hypothetical protein